MSARAILAEIKDRDIELDQMFEDDWINDLLEASDDETAMGQNIVNRLRRETRDSSSGVVENLDMERLVDNPEDLVGVCELFHTQGNYQAAIDVALVGESFAHRGFDHEHTIRLNNIHIRALLAQSRTADAQNLYDATEPNLATVSSPNLCTRRLLGVRISFAAGDIGVALVRAQAAVLAAEDLSERIKCQLVVIGISEALTGQGSETIYELSQIEPSLIYAQSDSPLAEMYMTAQIMHQSALLSQGKINRAGVLVNSPNHYAAEESPAQMVSKARYFGSMGDMDAALGCFSASVLGGAEPELSPQERVELRWWYAFLLHLANRKNDALAQAENIADYVYGSHAAGYFELSMLLLASCSVSVGDYYGAKLKIRSLAEAQNSPNVRIRAMHAAVQGVIGLHEKSLDRCVATLLEHDECVLCEDAAGIVGWLCRVHPPLLGLIASAYGADAIPCGVVEILDREQFAEGLMFARKMLTAKESKLLSSRFTRIAQWEANSHAASKPYRIKLFGALEISLEGRPLDLVNWRKNKSRSLFIAIAMKKGRDVSREYLLEQFWSDKTPADARNNYYVTWNNMKRMLGGLPKKRTVFPLCNSGERCQLLMTYCSLDVVDFDEAIQRAHRARALKDASETLRQYRIVSELYTGDLLPGDMYFEWLAPYRQRYHATFVEAMMDAARLCLEVPSCGDANQFISRALEVEHQKESLYVLAIRAFADSNRREDAIRLYLECKSYLAEEMGLDPSRELQNLYHQLLAEDTEIKNY